MKKIVKLINGNKIIRPAYKAVQDRREYKSMDER